MKINSKEYNIDQLITDFLLQSLEYNELNELNNWISESEENENYFIHRQEEWLSAEKDNDSENNTTFNKELAFEQFLIRTQTEDSVYKKPNRKLQLSIIQVAASIILLIGLLFGGYLIGKHTNNNTTNIVRVEAPMGSRSKTYLPDGTLVWLNAGSSLSYNNKFGKRERRVQLNGEAYFEVAKNKHKPFYVMTKDINVKVLGTKFDFSNYEDEEFIKVSLLEGHVQITSPSTKDKLLDLYPDQQMVYSKTEDKIIKESVESKNYKVWTNGYLFFDEEWLTEISRKLERSYNVNITIADDSLRHLRFYGNFKQNEQTIEDVLNALSSTDKLKYNIDGKNITLSPK